MKVYPFQFDTATLEVFPSEIFQDPYIVFHGTTLYHSENIENNGFLYEVSNLFDIEAIRGVACILKENKICLNTSKNLEDSIKRIEDYSLSFAYLSSFSLSFAVGEWKGGQIFLFIRKAEKLIKDVMEKSHKIQSQITEKIRMLFQVANDVKNSDGVIYAIKLEKPFYGINVSNNIIYSKKTIDKSNIIGKMILPKEIDTFNFNYDEFRIRNNVKIYNNKLDSLLENYTNMRKIIKDIENTDIENCNPEDIKKLIKKSFDLNDF